MYGMEKMKKQRLSTLLASALVAVMLTACGGGEDVGGADDVAERLKPVGSVAVAGKEPAAPAAVAPAEKEAPAAPAAEAAAPAAGVDGEAVYKKACLACHLAGVAGAPKVGDKAGWEPRLAKGMDALLASAIKGVPGTAMSPRGACANCTDEELKAAIEFMAGQ